VESAELTEAVARAKVAKLEEGKSVKYYEDVIKGFNAFGRLVRERLWAKAGGQRGDAGQSTRGLRVHELQ